MNQKDQFLQSIQQGYQFSGDAIILGTAILEGEALPNAWIKAPLSTFNRHGLIAGATGTGKTKTLQKIAEALSSQGCPVLVMDVKGDFSGISQPGTANLKIEERQKKIGLPWTPKQFPVEFLSISNEKGIKLRATVSEFGPVLFSKILELNDTQSSVISLIFKYCDDHALPLLDLKDFKKVLQFLTNEGKEDIEKQYGNISSASTGTIMRKVIELEEQGAEHFFGERSFDVEDLLKTDAQGRGYIYVLRLMDLQSKPKLFSTFMLCLMAEIYEKFPEEGDVEKPKLVIFIDEAHLIFRDASKTLLNEVEMIVKLIRSKGVGIFFCTQNPIDIPNEILAQLGMKIQHALRAFTAQDRKAIKLAAENYPLTDFYKVNELITSLGIGEAIATALDEKGAPTPLAHTLLCAPESRMDTISDQELSQIISRSQLITKYDEVIDRESAYEMLNAKLEQASAAPQNEGLGKVSVPPPPSRKGEKSTIEKISKNTMVRQVGRTFVREVARGILGVLGLGARRRRPRSSGWF